MSYQRKKLQILGGGFNLLPPGDKVPQTDYLLAQNFRVDRVGDLVARLGYQQVFSIAGAGLAHSAATMGGAKSPYYVGCNSSVTNPTSAVYYNGNPTPIATGFDGNRIGFASQNGFMFIMNRGNQGRHSAGSGFQAFNLTPPQAPVSAAAGSSPTPVPSVNYTYGTYGTTTNDNIAGGGTSQTVTPASMTLASGQQIIVGLGLIICDPASVNTEVVTVTAITTTTFTAVFRYPYPGPGNLVGEYGYVHSLTIAGTTYSFADIGYSNQQVPEVIAGIAGVDPNATVTYSGSGNTVVVAALAANVIIPISGSDGNPVANLGTGGITSLPSGTYQYFITFVSTDQSLESNSSPGSNLVTVTSQAVVLTIPTAPNRDAPVDTRIGFINIYRSGGTLGNAYLVHQIPSTAASPATTFTDTIPDLQVTGAGVVMPGADADHPPNDPPPAAAGIIGPYFGSLIAWSSAARVNRVWFTNPGLPQYWPGSANDQEGNWFDAGDEGEAVVWCTLHSNELIIYKEKSIWILIGPPVGGTLQQYRDGMGLAGQFALVSAGLVDYFVGPGGLHKFDMNNVIDVDMNVSPLFTTSMSNSPGLIPPGSVLPGSAWNSNLSTAYAVALGYGMGKLYVSYAEQATPAKHSILLVLHEDSGRWFYDRNADPGTDFYGWFFDGTAMLGLTGSPGTQALGMNVDDFRAFAFTDPASTPIECMYKSHYENCGLPDNQKMWLEVVVDCELPSTTGSVWASFDNGATLAELGTITAAGQRQSLTFPLNALAGLSAGGGVLARSIAIALDLTTSGSVVIHNVYLYYYVEARLADSIATIPVDLGVGQVKQCKELELDINTANGAVITIVASDLPGNVIATRETITVPSTAGRGVVKFPFPFQEGYLWQLSLTGAQFRLYAARLLMRIVGVYVEAYEAAAGFVWDSMEMTFDSGVTHIPRGYSMALASWPVKRAREISLEIDTVNQPVTVTLLTDLPGNQQAVRFTATVTANGRRFVRLPLPQGAATPIEGRIYRLQISGTKKFILYDAGIDIMPVGVYIEAYEATNPTNAAVWDSTIVDMGDPTAKTFDEVRLEMDSDAGGTAVLSLFTDLPGEAQALRGAYELTAGATGRAWVTVPVANITGTIEGRSPRLVITSTTGFRLYSAQIRYNSIGRYIAAASLSGSDGLNTLEYDFASERVKSYKRLEVDLNADGDVLLTVATSQTVSGISTIYTKTITTLGRQTIMVPLPPGVRGRLLRLTLGSASAARVYHVRVLARPLNEQQGGWVWADYPVEESSVVPAWKQLLVEPTPADWFWARVLSVEPTADTWSWVDVPIADVTEPA